MTSRFPASWIHGARDCRTHTGPAFQVHAFDDSTFIIRQSKCVHFEGPFLYLIIGRDAALLLDTGADPPGDAPLGVRELIDGILSRVAAERGRGPFRLVVAHSHSHGDHVAGDTELRQRPDTLVVGGGIDSIRLAFNINRWPVDLGSIDLGDRPLTVIPTPGHFEDHICIYDPATQLLLSGDILYAGRLVVLDWEAYRDSAERLAGFVSRNPLSYVLGAHIEMKRAPGRLFPIPSRFQPDEHVLELLPSHFDEWVAACGRLHAESLPEVHDDFILFPVRR